MVSSKFWYVLLLVISSFIHPQYAAVAASNDADPPIQFVSPTIMEHLKSKLHDQRGCRDVATYLASKTPLAKEAQGQMEKYESASLTKVDGKTFDCSKALDYWNFDLVPLILLNGSIKDRPRHIKRLLKQALTKSGPDLQPIARWLRHVPNSAVLTDSNVRPIDKNLIEEDDTLSQNVTDLVLSENTNDEGEDKKDVNPSATTAAAAVSEEIGQVTSLQPGKSVVEVVQDVLQAAAIGESEMHKANEDNVSNPQAPSPDEDDPRTMDRDNRENEIQSQVPQTSNKQVEGLDSGIKQEQMAEVESIKEIQVEQTSTTLELLPTTASEVTGKHDIKIVSEGVPESTSVHVEEVVTPTPAMQAPVELTKSQEQESPVMEENELEPESHHPRPYGHVPLSENWVQVTKSQEQESPVMKENEFEPESDHPRPYGHVPLSENWVQVTKSQEQERPVMEDNELEPESDHPRPNEHDPTIENWAQQTESQEQDRPVKPLMEDNELEPESDRPRPNESEHIPSVENQEEIQSQPAPAVSHSEISENPESGVDKVQEEFNLELTTSQTTRATEVEPPTPIPTASVDKLYDQSLKQKSSSQVLVTKQESSSDKGVRSVGVVTDSDLPKELQALLFGVETATTTGTTSDCPDQTPVTPELLGQNGRVIKREGMPKTKIQTDQNKGHLTREALLRYISMGIVAAFGLVLCGYTCVLCARYLFKRSSCCGHRRTCHLDPGAVHPTHHRCHHTYLTTASLDGIQDRYKCTSGVLNSHADEIFMIDENGNRVRRSAYKNPNIDTEVCAAAGLSVPEQSNSRNVPTTVSGDHVGFGDAETNTNV